MIIRYSMRAGTLCFLLFVLSFKLLAQNENSGFQVDTVINCELVQLELSAAHIAGKNKSIIVISRLGDGEHQDKLHKQRLKEVVDHFKNSWLRKAETVITARGERKKGMGQIEFYVDGKLAAIVGVRKRKPLKIQCESANV